MLAVAAPARLQKSSARPLGGLRFVVKDMFDVQGLTTTLFNKAFYEIKQPPTFTASCVQRLVHVGADLLATTKMSSMISREEPTEAIDYQSPFNPRGDGYQSPAGSSSGGAAAVAAYEGLDFAVSEDSSGSRRRPTAANGCFEYRQTHDDINLHGLSITLEQSDTPVLHTRDFEKIELIAPLWVKSFNEGNVPHTADKLRLFYPQDYVPGSNSEHLEQLNRFLTDLSQATGSEVSCISVSGMWEKYPPPYVKDQNIHEYLEDVIVNTYYRAFHDSQAWFRETYLKKHGKSLFRQYLRELEMGPRPVCH